MYDVERYYGDKDEQRAEIARLAREDFDERYGYDDDDDDDEEA